MRAAPVLECAAALLAAGADVNTRQAGSGKAALHWAAERGHEACAQLLLQHGAEVDARTREGWSALFFAARMGHTHVIRLLRGAGARMDMLDTDRDSPRDIAASHGHHAAVRELGL